jgi:hypothetical protein
LYSSSHGHEPNVKAVITAASVLLKKYNIIQVSHGHFSGRHEKPSQQVPRHGAGMKHCLDTILYDKAVARFGETHGGRACGPPLLLSVMALTLLSFVGTLHWLSGAKEQPQ